MTFFYNNFYSKYLVMINAFTFTHYLHRLSCVHIVSGVSRFTRALIISVACSLTKYLHSFLRNRWIVSQTEFKAACIFGWLLSLCKVFSTRWTKTKHVRHSSSRGTSNLQNKSDYSGIIVYLINQNLITWAWVPKNKIKRINTNWKDIFLKKFHFDK